MHVEEIDGEEIEKKHLKIKLNTVPQVNKPFDFVTPDCTPETSYSGQRLVPWWSFLCNCPLFCL